MSRAPGPVLRVSVLSRSTLFIISPALALFLLIPLSLIVWPPGRSTLPWVLFGPCVAIAILIMARLALTHLEVGRDGVLVRRGRTRRFLPFSSLESIEDRGQDLRFVLVGGEELVIRTGKEEQISKARYVEQVEAAVQRIESEIERRRARDPDDAARDLDGRVLLAHARVALGRTEEDARAYRSQALPPVDDLWRLVDDPDADELARAAAAVSLRREPDAKVRLRVRSDETVSPHLRKLLRVAADDEPDRDVSRALDACARRSS